MRREGTVSLSSDLRIMIKPFGFKFFVLVLASLHNRIEARSLSISLLVTSNFTNRSRSSVSHDAAGETMSFGLQQEGMIRAVWTTTSQEDVKCESIRSCCLFRP